VSTYCIELPASQHLDIDGHTAFYRVSVRDCQKRDTRSYSGQWIDGLQPTHIAAVEEELLPIFAVYESTAFVFDELAKRTLQPDGIRHIFLFLFGCGLECGGSRRPY
jgi:hypothetical protein